MMKYIKCFVVTFLFIIMLVLFESFAVESAIVSAGNIDISENGFQSVPVCIKNNPGLMGYKITVEYPDGVDIREIGIGTLCTAGNFNSDLEIHKDNKINIVWNNTENVIGNGSLFILNLKVGKNTVNKKIKLSYSQDDTFDENWNDVVLTCSDIEITSEAKSNDYSRTETVSNRNYDYIINVIDNELTNKGFEDVESIPEGNDNAFIKDISDKLHNVEISTKDDVKKIYEKAVKEKFEFTVNQTLDPDTVAEIVSDALDEMKVSSIDKLDKKSVDDKEKFNSFVIEKIKSEYPDLDQSINKIDENSKFEAIKKVYSESCEKTDKNKNSTTYLYYIIAVAALTMLTAAMIVVLKRKKKCGESDEKNIVNSINHNSDS